MDLADFSGAGYFVGIDWFESASVALRSVAAFIALPKTMDVQGAAS